MLAIILDSSTVISTAVLAEAGVVIAKHSSSGRALTHLHIAISNVLKSAAVRMRDIEKIGVIQGPGSWTGLHVAITSAKTLAQVYNLPLVPISFIDALALSSQPYDGLLTAIYKSPKGNIFSRSYAANAGVIEPVSDLQKLSIPELMLILKNFDRPIRLVGEISTDLAAAVQNYNIAEITFEHILYPSEDALALMVHSISDIGNDFQSMMYLEPLYMQKAGEGPQIFRKEK